MMHIYIVLRSRCDRYIVSFSLVAARLSTTSTVSAAQKVAVCAGIRTKELDIVKSYTVRVPNGKQSNDVFFDMMPQPCKKQRMVFGALLGVVSGRGAGRRSRICSDRTDRLATIVATAYFLQ